MTTVHTIDLEYQGRPRCVASYVLLGPGGPVMIETGPASTVQTLERGLADLGLAPADVKHVLVTHIHLDHAGAAGWMAAHGARVYVHEFGARHLVDPSRLLESAGRIYGDRMDALWGRMRPVPEAQVVAVHDGDALEVAGLRVTAIETPGHARHHHAFEARTDDGLVAFTGDAAATYVPGCGEFVAVPTPPPEFDLEAWIASVQRLEARGFDVLYPTHYGAVRDAAGHLRRVKQALHDHAAFVAAMIEQDLPIEEMRRRYRQWFVAAARAAGMPEDRMGFYVTDSLAAMNLTGIHRYWTKVREPAAR